jgi:hypothetical protein
MWVQVLCSGTDLFFIQHGVYEIEDILALLWSCVGNAVTVDIGITAYQKLKADGLFSYFYAEIKRGTVVVLLLDIGENLRGQHYPVEPNHGACF